MKRILSWVVALSLPAAAFAATGDVVLSFPSSFDSPDGLAWDGAFLWATDCSTSRIDKVDPATGRVVGSIDVASVGSDELAWDGAALWVSDHTATEMPGMGAPPPGLYRVDPATATVLVTLDAPGQSKYPMGMAWDGRSLWNVDPGDGKIFQLDPAMGAIKRSLPSPVSGACGLTWDGACLWLSDATTNGRIYHLDPATGEVLRDFDGPGGQGHQSTGVAWDGRNLWVHDEAIGRARIYALEIEDITEGGRCAGALGSGRDGGGPRADGGAARPDAQAEQGTSSKGGCSVAPATTAPITPGLVGVVLGVAALAPLRRRPRATARVVKWAVVAILAAIATILLVAHAAHLATGSSGDCGDTHRSTASALDYCGQGGQLDH